MFPALPTSSPVRPALPPARRARPSHVLLAALIWSVTLAALAVLGFLVLVVAVWSAASGQSPVPLLLGAAGVVVAGTVLLSGLYAAPFLRRMSPAGRLALIGALVGPFPVAAVAYVFRG